MRAPPLKVKERESFEHIAMMRHHALQQNIQMFLYKMSIINFFVPQNKICLQTLISEHALPYKAIFC